MHISAKELQAAAKRIKIAKDDADREIQEIEDKASRLEELHRLFSRLSRSWQDHDPGKYGIHVFFVRDYVLTPQPHGLPHAQDIEKFWVAELANDPEEIKLGRKRRYVYAGESERVAVPLGELSEVKREKCPDCANEGLVIGTYYQTYDSSEGDDWEKCLHVLCLNCLTATTIARQVMDGRF